MSQSDMEIDSETEIDEKEILIPKDLMNKVILNYLVIEGFKTAAEKFAKETGQDLNINKELIEQRIEI